MPEDLSKKTICVIDNGLFMSFARTIAPAFKKVYYYTPWQGPFSKRKDRILGEGFPEIERENDPLGIADEIDCWVFLDLCHAGTQVFLRKLGARVWGAGYGEELETDRWEFYKWLTRRNLPALPTKHIVGIPNLREHLQKVDDKWIKLRFGYERGDKETWHHANFKESQSDLDDLEQRLSGDKENTEFVVVDSLADAVEIGYDGYTIDGQFPEYCQLGYEIKGCGFITVAQKYSQIPEFVRRVNREAAPFFKGEKYRGFFSSEIRYGKEKKPYFIDPCCRLPFLANEAMQDLFTGWPQAIWDGSEGKLTSVKPVAKYAISIGLDSDWAAKNWQTVIYPPKIERHVRLRFHSRVNGVNKIVPQGEAASIGVVVGTGNTILEAAHNAAEHVKQVKANHLHSNVEAIVHAVDTVIEGQKFGIQFTSEKLPSPEELKKAIG